MQPNYNHLRPDILNRIRRINSVLVEHCLLNGQPKLHHTDYTLSLCHIKQQQKMGKIQKTGINLCRDQSNIVGCKIWICKRNRQRPWSFFPITAACQKASNPAKSLCQCNGWHHQIKILQKFQLLYPAVQPAHQNSSDDSSIYHKSIWSYDLPWILQKFPPVGDPEQNLRRCKSTNGHHTTR